MNRESSIHSSIYPKVKPASRTCWSPFHPPFHAWTMKNMATFHLLDELIDLEAFLADGANFATSFHDERFWHLNKNVGVVLLSPLLQLLINSVIGKRFNQSTAQREWSEIIAFNDKFMTDFWLPFIIKNVFIHRFIKSLSTNSLKNRKNSRPDSYLYPHPWIYRSGMLGISTSVCSQPYRHSLLKISVDCWFIRSPNHPI